MPQSATTIRTSSASGFWRGIDVGRMLRVRSSLIRERVTGGPEERMTWTASLSRVSSLIHANTAAMTSCGRRWTGSTTRSVMCGRTSCARANAATTSGARCPSKRGSMSPSLFARRASSDYSENGPVPFIADSSWNRSQCRSASDLDRGNRPPKSRRTEPSRVTTRVGRRVVSSVVTRWLRGSAAVGRRWLAILVSSGGLVGHLSLGSSSNRKTPFSQVGDEGAIPSESTKLHVR